MYEQLTPERYRSILGQFDVLLKFADDQENFLLAALVGDARDAFVAGYGTSVPDAG